MPLHYHPNGQIELITDIDKIRGTDLSYLKEAIINNDNTKVLRLLQSDPENLILGFGLSVLQGQLYYSDDSPLSLVIALDNFDLLQRFIDYVGINAIDVNGNSIIYLTVKHQKPNLLNYILTTYQPEIPVISSQTQFKVELQSLKYPQTLAVKTNKVMFWTLVHYGYPVNYYIQYDRNRRTVISELLKLDYNLELDEIQTLIDLGVPTIGLTNFTDRLDIWQLLYDNGLIVYASDDDGFLLSDPLYTALKICNFPVSFIAQLLNSLEGSNKILGEEPITDKSYVIDNRSYYAALAANLDYDPQTKLEIAQLLDRHGASLYISEYTNVLLSIIPKYYNNNNALLFRFLATKVGLTQVDGDTDKTVLQLLQQYKDVPNYNRKNLYNGYYLIYPNDRMAKTL